MENLFSEIRCDYADDKGVVHIDGWRTANGDENGETIAFVTRGEVYWRNPEFQFQDNIKEMVAEVIAEQKKEMLSLKEKIQKAVSGVVYDLNAKPRKTFTDGSPLEDKLSLINEGVDKIINLL
jgi:hypothetical protein